MYVCIHIYIYDTDVARVIDPCCLSTKVTTGLNDLT